MATTRFTEGWSPAIPHLGRSGEIADLRSDVEGALVKVADELDNSQPSFVRLLKVTGPVTGTAAVGFDIAEALDVGASVIAGVEKLELAVFDDEDLTIPSVSAVLDTATEGVISAGAGSAALKVKTATTGSFRCSLTKGTAGVVYVASSLSFGSSALICNDVSPVTFA
jgi:hypothetical protein